MSTAPKTKVEKVETGTDSELPQGWAEVCLQEIGRLFCGQSPAARFVNTEGKGTPYVSGPDQWNGRKLRLDKWTTAPKRVVGDGCTFITVKGAGVGTIFPGVPSAIGRDIYAYEPAPKLDPEFVMRAIECTVSDIKRHAAGDIPGLTRDHLLTHKIGLPPVNEQQRIARQIADLLSREYECTDRLRKVPIYLKHFRQSVLAAACSGKLTENWRKEHISVQSGATLLNEIKRELGTKNDRLTEDTAV